ncbi:MAG: [FeFe] hydrogenase H-cluster radical SAM maturase HydG [Armatimonadetes bacterium]|nr:[FeFe] hydrogenase H-cluster radical SAM maturase HydG [Armatimonadota bacterium]
MGLLASACGADVRRIIDEHAITRSLEEAQEPDDERLADLIAKARECKGWTRDELAEMVKVRRPEAWEAIFEAAGEVKQRIYGRRVVLFAPLYVSNECVGNCLYCAFRRDNKLLKRRTLTPDEIAREVEWLIDHGYKRLLLVFGDHPKNGVESMVRAVEAVYSTRRGRGEIRRVNVNAAPLSYEDFCKLKPAGIGTFQVFQETYHRRTYEYMHPVGPKANYEWRVTVWDRCFPAGIDDVGLGVLFGLYDWRWDLLALIDHAAYLDREYGVGPHTISVPRLEPAFNTPLASNPPAPVSDEDFLKIVAVIRLAVPYTGMILSTRERPEIRRRCLELGVSQISAGSSTSPGGYTEEHPDETDTRQFEIGDHRPLDDVMYDLCELGYLPSFCTACYRSGRTGQTFMSLAKPGEIHRFCLPNALLTFKEYLVDYASPRTREAGERVIRQHLKEIENESIRRRTEEKLRQIQAGARDVFF